jgi:hypothetical protein
MILKSVACVKLVNKAAEEIRIAIFKSFVIKKINDLVTTSNKLTDNLQGGLASDLESDVAHGSPVVDHVEISYLQSLRTRPGLSVDENRLEVSIPFHSGVKVTDVYVQTGPVPREF